MMNRTSSNSGRRCQANSTSSFHTKIDRTNEYSTLQRRQYHGFQARKNYNSRTHDSNNFYHQKYQRSHQCNDNRFHNDVRPENSSHNSVRFHLRKNYSKNSFNHENKHQRRIQQLKQELELLKEKLRNENKTRGGRYLDKRNSRYWQSKFFEEKRKAQNDQRFTCGCTTKYHIELK